MILSNDGLVAFHYKSYGTFFLQQNRLHNIYRGLPTTNIIEPNKQARFGKTFPDLFDRMKSKKTLLKRGV